MEGGLILVVDRRAVRVRLEHRCVRVDLPDGRFERVPLAQLAAVVVHGSPEVRCDVWRALAEAGVAAALVPGRGDGATAWLGAGLAPYAHRRVAQHRVHADAAARLAVARRVVALKLEAMARAAPLLGVEVSEALDEARARLARADSVAALMGVEGHAAAVWYAALARRLDPRWGFSGRNRRPPRDPVNALLSLGYTLAGAAARRQVAAAGLDPALGMLHETAPAREALALDALEPLRPGVDVVAVRLLARLAPEGFAVSPGEGCRLRKPARAVFYAAWAEAAGRWPVAAAPPEAGGAVSLEVEAARAVRAIWEGIRDAAAAAEGRGRAARADARA